jgi:hypothetical protein
VKTAGMKAAGTGRHGTSMNVIMLSPERRRRRARRLRAQEKKWAEQSSEVVSRQMTDEELAYYFPD